MTNFIVYLIGTLLVVAGLAYAATRLGVNRAFAADAVYRRLKNCTARSCRSAAALVLNVPRLRRRPVFGFFFREYRRYVPDASLRIIPTPPS